MNPRISLAIIIFALMAGAVAIFLSNRLMRKYLLSYLSSYFYYLIFTYIFGAYSIIGSQVILFLLSDHNVEPETVYSASSILIAMGIPFLILGMYMFLRFTREIMQNQISKIFSLVYFIIFLLLFAAYIFLNSTQGTIGSISFKAEPFELVLIFSVIHAIVYGYALLYLYTNTRKINDINKRRAFRWFSYWYSIIILLNIVSLNLATVNPLFGLFFILGYMGFHLLPVLFLHFYLLKHYVEKVENSSFDEKMTLIAEQYGISKRETEVFGLICKGMTNQEISDSLFISVQTVKDHIYSIFLKTGVKNRVQLTNLLVI